MSVSEEDTGGKQVDTEGSSGSGLVTIVWKQMAHLGEYDNRIKQKKKV